MRPREGHHGAHPERDLLWLATHTPVSAIMSRDPQTAGPDDTLEHMTATILGGGLHGLPVVDEEGTPIGFVSARDLLRRQYECGDTEERVPLRGDLARGFHVHRVSHATARDVMAPLSVTLEENQPITVAAALMSFEHVHRAPVVSRRGRLVGVLSALDVLRWLAVADGYRLQVGA